MKFFDSFQALGYSAINLVLVTLVIAAVIYRGLGLHRRSPVYALLLLAVLGTGFVFATNFLADQNRMLNEAIRSEGGIKRNLPKN